VIVVSVVGVVSVRGVGVMGVRGVGVVAVVAMMTVLFAPFHAATLLSIEVGIEVVGAGILGREAECNG